jgi:hypothetical protein
MAWCIDGGTFYSGDGVPPTNISNDGTYTWEEDDSSGNPIEDRLRTLETTIERLERRIVELEGNSRKRPSFIDFHFLKEKKVETVQAHLSDEDLDMMLDLM